MTSSAQYCSFFVDGLCFGIEVLKVREVIRFQEMTRIPLAPPVVSGLINLRGQIVTAIDLRKTLGLTDRSADQLPMNVVVDTSHGVVSLLVDEIGDVQVVQENAFELPPATLDSAARRLIRGCYKLDSRLLLVLDTEQSANLKLEPPLDGPDTSADQPAPISRRQRTIQPASIGDMNS